MSETRNKIFGSSDEPMTLRPVSVPEWGVTVFIRGWTAKERDRFDNEVSNKENEQRRDNIRARVLVQWLFEEDGKRVFTDEDAVALGEKHSIPVDRLWTDVMRMAGVFQGDAEAIRKNSSTGQSAGSPAA